MDVAGRLSDRLAAHFGANSVFKDVDSIPVGGEFRTTVQREIQQCDVIIALIGNQWLTVTDAAGRRRLDDPNDFVRIEIETALQSRIPVVPVLVRDTQMPASEDLPESLRGLAFRNAASLRTDPDFHHDMDRLIRGLRRSLRHSLQHVPKSLNRSPKLALAGRIPRRSL
jgi:hypothetical protein